MTTLSLGAPQVDLTADAGSDVDFTLTITDSTGTAINLTGYTAVCTVKAGYSESAVVLSASSAINVASKITITPLTGKVAVHLDHTNTAALATSAARTYVYDVTLSNGTVTNRRLFGNLNFRPQTA